MSNHSFDINIATEYKSIEIAILVWHFQYWIIKNKRLGRNEYEGHTWTYQTIEEIAAVFPYWSYDQVQRLISKALKLNILIKGNFNKSKFDRTVWYAFENEEKFSIRRFRKMEDAESENGTCEIASPIPDTIPYTKTDIDIAQQAAPAVAKAPAISSSFSKRKKIPEEVSEVAERVFLTPTQKASILKKVKGDEEMYNRCIERLSQWKIKECTVGGSDYLSILKWVIGAIKSDEVRIGQKQAFAENRIRTDQIIAEKIWNKCKGRKENDIVISAKYIEFIQGVNAPSIVIEYGSKDFLEKCREQLRKRKIDLEIP